jgi:hypothetical protein
MVRVALTAGDPELAARLASEMRPGISLHRNALASARALLAEHNGDLTNAAFAFAQAAEDWHQFGVPSEQAQALLGPRTLPGGATPASSCIPGS